MFLTITLIAVVSAPLPEPDPAEQKAADALEELGFKIVREGASRQVVEVRYLGRRDKKVLPPPDPKDLAPLSQFHNLKKLDLHGLAVDETLGLIRSPQLQEVSLQATQVTAKGLKKLADCKKLVSLDLDWVGITDDDLKLLASFPALKSIGLQKTRITDEGVKALEKSKLTSFSSSRFTPVTGSGISHVGMGCCD